MAAALRLLDSDSQPELAVHFQAACSTPKSPTSMTMPGLSASAWEEELFFV